jgi:hypothetical protein
MILAGRFRSRMVWFMMYEISSIYAEKKKKERTQ